MGPGRKRMDGGGLGEKETHFRDSSVSEGQRDR